MSDEKYWSPLPKLTEKTFQKWLDQLNILASAYNATALLENPTDPKMLKTQRSITTWS